MFSNTDAFGSELMEEGSDGGTTASSASSGPSPLHRIINKDENKTFNNNNCFTINVQWRLKGITFNQTKYNSKLTKSL